MDQLFVKAAISSFLAEDIGAGDLTSASIFGQDHLAKAEFLAQEPMVAAGLATVAAQVFLLINPTIQCTPAIDGARISAGQSLLTLEGPILDLLKGERVALNLTQRLCGIATFTARFVELVKPLPVKIVDTRKTTPGLRAFEKYAVRIGGGYNHRFSLSDGVMIKDNHLAAAGSIAKAVALVRGAIPHTIKVEVEADTLDQVKECLECGVEIILLDNMDCETMRQAVDLTKKRAILEASGGVNLINVRQVAETGVDIISIGALTHSAPACDISMIIA
ncbi:MAG: carboxylating nicotinate-nucleotide diphosphorylase [Proteobacteria bacterium]|nr:carboxylating nicotinate-nucleotide diphosphorylase [Desulfobulbaceae bacterium]MBU4152144.1 carboxylating nicotinate-nucleotide diphosphorylase [Pseudomonadota bacterium]MDP2105293.1 carboxylating nicotinate-nucleotide diphosphorylase [Desulfobulbaceae bacterium]